MSAPRLVGRLAPSPTGAQHVGNARTYLIAWLSIRSRGGRVILRTEDIDSPRVKPWAAQQAIDDLRWLGLDWDEGPDIGGPHAPYIQTERVAEYEAALLKLQHMELPSAVALFSETGRLLSENKATDTHLNRVYPCTCTRTDIVEAASAPHIGQEGPVYPGTCSQRPASAAVSLTAEYAWRFRVSDRNLDIDDLFEGPVSCNPCRELGDFVVGKKDGTPAYQLAVVVDDHAMGVTEVCRGADLLPSAFRQLEVYEAFGWSPPRFMHVPMVIGPDGRRLAKRHGDTRISVLRDRGVPPERLLGLLAWSCGWQSNRQPVSLAELLPLFDLSLLPHTPFVMTDELWRELYD
jgi:glutamyl-tRNA synthetase